MPLPENLAELYHNELNTPSVETRQVLSGDKGKGRSREIEDNPPTSPQMLNVGYGTPFRSSSQFFDKPDRQKFPLPVPTILSKQNVLVGLGLPNTPAFQDLDDPPRRRNTLQSRRSNPFEQRDQANINMEPSSSAYDLPSNSNTNSNPNHANQPNHGSGGNGDPSGGGGGNNCINDPYGNQDGDSNEGSSSSRSNGPSNPAPQNNGGGDPPGGDPPGGGGGPNRGNFGNPRNDSRNQGLIPYGDTRATIRNDLKQDQLPIWDGNKDTPIEYFWKVQQLAALEGDIPHVRVQPCQSSCNPKV